MAERDLLLKALDDAHWELSEAFKDMPDEDLWTRPAPRLLSVGELAAHIAYWEAKSFFPEGLESPLKTEAARYYPATLEEPVNLPLGAAAVLAEVQRIHEACKTAFLAENPDLNATNPNREWPWTYTLQYQAFHVAYHTGQIYSVRHLLGHETADN